jgi:hypothetical protein
MADTNMPTRVMRRRWGWIFVGDLIAQLAIHWQMYDHEMTRTAASIGRDLENPRMGMPPDTRQIQLILVSAVLSVLANIAAAAVGFSRAR